MTKHNQLIVVLCTVPDQVTAEKLGQGLVEERLAACVTSIPGVKSFYRWQEETHADMEIQLLIKTRPERFDDLAAWLAENHPYDVPEVVALRAERVSESYLSWAVEQTTKR
ncbi:MAG TPA: divalent-cation tolerance protein CutA [Polyangiales bacterium]|nr:divalent-cation tolerance protein CutA [Polyangiales bacterium]